jgi:UDP-glucose 4-epimerase
LKILITGGLGNLGLWMTQHFLEKGFEVDVIARSETFTIKHKNYRLIQGDVTILTCLNQAITCYYDSCIHLASYNEHFNTGYECDALKINALGTENLCKALSNHGVGKFIYFSTFHVYGVSSGIINESTQVCPKNHYGLTHYFAEKYVELYSRKYGFGYCIFRLTNSYGCPKDRKTNKWYLVLNDLCLQSFQNREIRLESNGGVYRNFIWAGDVVGITEKCVSDLNLKNDCYNLSSNSSISIQDVALIVINAYQQKFGNQVLLTMNEKDKSKYQALSVENTKLLFNLDWSFKDRMFEEALNIFTLLETNEK